MGEDGGPSVDKVPSQSKEVGESHEAAPESGVDAAKVLQFFPWQSSVDVGFWERLAGQKLNTMRLKEDPISITGFFAPSSHAQVSSHLSLSQDSLPLADPPLPDKTPSSSASSPPHPPSSPRTQNMASSSQHNPADTAWGRQRCPAPGTLYNTNTIDSFKALNRPALLQSCANQLWDDILSGRAEADPSLLNRFVLISFADLKKWAFYYWFAFPSLVLPQAASSPHSFPASEVLPPNQLAAATGACDAWRGGHVSGDEEGRANQETHVGGQPFFLLHVPPNGTAHARPLSDFSTATTEGGQVLVGFYDPSNLSTNPGWPLRNLLALAAARWRATSLRVLCLRERRGRVDLSQCPVFNVQIPALPEWQQVGAKCPDAVGWERNLRGKSGPRFVDLAPSLDPARLASAAADLNLKLMRWRLLPSLDVPMLTGTRCLLLGAGTLGCQVARGLMAWGVKKITFVDYGRVAMSNPLRQSLFTHEDCLAGGRPKAEAAATSLKRIFPDIDSQGVQMAIPMPGHPVREQDRAAVSADCRQLASLVASHDVIFLLTDTRESRWLPTLLCTTANKVAINIALGFDTWLVMRHGHGSPPPPNPYAGSSQAPPPPQQKTIIDGVAKGGTSSTPADMRLGCYFCNDVVAPLDSTANRTLDQQCTVTRPGLAPVAAALGVELAVSLLHHPLRINAPADSAAAITSSTEMPLGLLPHQIRGFMAHFSQLLVTGLAFDKCTACSPKVVEEYRSRGDEFLLEVFDHPTYLEDLTGLTAMLGATQTMDLDWDDVEGDEDF